MKLIIQQMKMIESQIPKEWNELQKAKYIYTVLAQNIEYERDESKYETGNCSNLMGLITGKSICAGYNIPYGFAMTHEALKVEIEKMLTTDGPYVLECAVKEEDNVMPMVPPGKPINEMILEFKK